MQLLQIDPVRQFMALLLTSDMFDHFELTEASITTFITTTLDGSLHAEYFDTDDAQNNAHTGYVLWRDCKSVVHALIKGHRSPLRMHIVLRLAEPNVQKLLTQSGLDLTTQQIAGLYLNIRFDQNKLTCTTGTALNFFTLDKSLEHVWDEMIEKLFRARQIPFEK